MVWKKGTLFPYHFNCHTFPKTRLYIPCQPVISQLYAFLRNDSPQRIYADSDSVSGFLRMKSIPVAAMVPAAIAMM